MRSLNFSQSVWFAMFCIAWAVTSTMPVEAATRIVLLKSGMCGSNVQYHVTQDLDTGIVELNCFVIPIPGDQCIDSYGKTSEQPWYEYSSVIDYVHVNDVLEAGSYCFAEFSDCKGFYLGDRLVSIKKGALLGCTSVESIRIPDSTVVVGNYAFKGDSALKSVQFGSGLRSIGKNAFAKCNLQELELPNRLRSIGKYAFAFNKELKRVSFSKSDLVLGDYCFNQCVSLGSTEVPKWVVCGKGVFRGCG